MKPIRPLRCFVKEKNALWRNVIIAKYGVDILCWWTKKSPFTHGMGYWRPIFAGLECFKSLVNFEVKNGPRVFLWHDVWCGDQPPKFQFPNPFRMAILKDAPVHDVASWNGDQIHWNMIFLRSPNDWEEDTVSDFLATLAKMNVLPKGIDKIVGPYDPKSSFTIKSCMMVGMLPMFPFLPCGSLKHL